MPSQQIHDGADSGQTRLAPPPQGSWERVGWDQERQAVESRRQVSDAASANAASEGDARVVRERAGRGVATGGWVKILGAVGFVVAGAGAGILAHQMGYDARLTTVIAGLVGVAGAAAGIMLPLLLRAIGWTILAALAGGVGGGALYLLMHIAPAFVERWMALAEPFLR